MTTLLGILVVLTLIIGTLSWFSPDGVDVHLEQEINAPAAKVWDVLAHQFVEIDQWSSYVDASRALDISEMPEGIEVAASAPIPGRATTNQLGELHEIFIKYSEEKRVFTFHTAKLPPIINLAQNTSRVINTGDDRSLLTFDIRIEPRGIFKVLGPLLKPRFVATWGAVQKELKRYAETGQPSK